MNDSSVKTGGKRSLTSSELSTFCLQTSMILKAGIPLHDGLELLTEDLADPKLSAVLKEVSTQVAERQPLSIALEQAGVFPLYLVNMVRIGSDSGRLDEVMTSLSFFYHREDTLRQTIRSAVIYPLTLIAMMFLVMMVLSAKVLPVFEQVFQGLGASMSPTATAIMNLGLAASRYSVILLVIGALILAALVFLFQSEQGGQLMARISSIGRMSEKISLARFTSSLSMMLTSGLDTEQAVKLSTTVITDRRLLDKIYQCIDLLESGTSFLGAVTQLKIYPPMTIRMMSLGFQAGNLDQVMRQIADSDESEIETSLLKRVSLIEPVSVAFLSLMIGMILISVMLPLMGVMSSIGS